MNTNVTDKLKLKYSENKDIVSSVLKCIENGRKLYVVFHIVQDCRLMESVSWKGFSDEISLF